MPVYSEQAIVRSFQRKDGWEYIEQMEFWCEKARELLYKNPLECDHIREVVKRSGRILGIVAGVFRMKRNWLLKSWRRILGG